MLKNYLTIALRNLLKRKFYSFINVFGLSVGITFTLLIGVYVYSELQVNRSIRNVPQQYIVQSQWKVTDMGMPIATLAPMGTTLQNQFPGLVASYYRFHGVTAIVSKGDKHFRENVQVGDSTLLTMFGFPLLHGNPATALNRPDAVVITAHIAAKYFGKTDVLNQVLTIQTPNAGKKDFIITAVTENIPANSVTDIVTHDQVFIPMSNIPYFTGSESDKNWQNRFMVTYLELQPGISPQDLHKPVKQVLSSHAPDDVKGKLEIELTQLQDFYLEANNGVVKQMLITLSGIALFILLMAIINFINITIGVSSSRLKEIGIRKVLGGIKKQLVFQFLTESLILTSIALLFSLVFYELLRPFISDVLARPLLSLTDFTLYFAVALLILTLIIGLLAGIYPAFVLSSLQSVDSLKGKLKSVKESILFRRSLITFQFVIAIFVFVGAIIISQQVSYFFNKNLGYKKEQVLVVSSVPRDWSPAGVEKMEHIKNEFLQIPNVQQVSLSYEIPNGNASGGAGFYPQGADSTQAIPITMLFTDEDYAHTYQIQMKEGAFFHANKGSFDSAHIVLNEAAAKALGWEKGAVGKQLKVQGTSTPFTVHGVTKNFHFTSMHETIRPLVFIHVKNAILYRYLSFKLQTTHLSKTVAAIEHKWRTLLPEAPFDYGFMDDKLQQLYQKEIQLKKASNLATVLSLIIMMTGVLGLVSLSVAKRTKEVGIRKVLGASVVNIMTLFLKEFAFLLVIANLLAGPLIYLAMRNWLEEYAYRITIDWNPFVWVGVILFAVTSLVVGIQSIRSALANPITSLRNE